MVQLGMPVWSPAILLCRKNRKDLKKFRKNLEITNELSADVDL